MTKENKVYCCSNHLRTETLIIGVIELIVSGFSLLMTGMLAYSYSNERQWLNNTAKEDDMGDLRTFLKLPTETQQLVILMTFLADGAAVFASLILLMGAHHKNAIILKIWFILGCMKFFYTVFTTLAFVYKTQHKIFYTGVSLMYVMYSLYTLHIVRLFIRELSAPPTSQSSAQLHPQMYPEDEDGRGSAATDIDARFGIGTRTRF